MSDRPPTGYWYLDKKSKDEQIADLTRQLEAAKAQYDKSIVEMQDLRCSQIRDFEEQLAAKDTEIAALTAERDALKEKNVKLRNGIKKTMWVSRWREEALVTCCVGCGRSEWDVRDNGHDTDCWLAALLKGE